MEVKDGQVNPRYIVLRKRVAMYGKVNHVLNNTYIDHCSYDPLSSELLLLKDRDGIYRGMVMQYDANGIGTVRDDDGNVIGAGEGAQSMPLNHKGQRP